MNTPITNTQTPLTFRLGTSVTPILTIKESGDILVDGILTNNNELIVQTLRKISCISSGNVIPEPVAPIDKTLTAEQYLIQHLLNRCEENSTTKLCDEEITEILDDPEMIAFVQ